MASPVSIRASLIWNLVLVVVLLGGSILALTFVGARRTLRELSETLSQRTLATTEQTLEGFFGPVRRELLLAKEAGRRGLLAVEGEGDFVGRFQPFMRLHPQITTIVLADANGDEVMLLRDGERWRLRRSRPESRPGEAEWLEWTNDRRDDAAARIELDYDARTRPWYRGAMERRRAATADGRYLPEELVHWTDPYVFFTTQQPGITASVTYTDDEGGVHVLGFDVLLRDISEFTTSLRVEKEGRVFVTTSRGEVVGLPREPVYADAAARTEDLLKQPGELRSRVVADAAAAFVENGELLETFRFPSGDLIWLGATRRFDLSPHAHLVMSVVVPEVELLGGMTRLRGWILAVIGIALLIAIARMVVLAHAYSRPIEALVRESDRIGGGDLEPGPPIESSVREIQRLAKAHDHMRTALGELMRIERDLQIARQIQQRTFPDALPALPGFELAGWSVPAEATGGDTYDAVELPADDHAPPRAVLMLADATGHGMGPALSATQLRSMLRMAVRMGGTLAQVAHHINEQLFQDLPEGRFITTWLGLLDAETARLASYSAGQGPLLHYVHGEDRVETLPADDLPFGVVPKLEITAPVFVDLAPGDLFAVFSDGIYEAHAPDREQLGHERVVELLRRHQAASPEEILERVREAVETFTHGAPAEDDRTVLLIKRA